MIDEKLGGGGFPRSRDVGTSVASRYSKLPNANKRVKIEVVFFYL